MARKGRWGKSFSREYSGHMMLFRWHYPRPQAGRVLYVYAGTPGKWQRVHR